LRRARPGDTLIAMNRRGSLRASDADRDHFIERLHRAATEGRIGAEELEQRVAAALKARTYGDLDATVADLPRPRERERERADRRPVRRGAAGWALSTVRANPWLLIFLMPAVTTAAALMLAVTVVWAVVVVLVMALGGGRHRRPPRGPWMYTRHRGIYGPPRGRARSYWA
jgi:hypothetical protein